MAKSYQQLQQELDEVLMQLQADNLDIDKAFELHKEGQALVRELENYLKKAEANLKTTKL